MTDKHTPEPWVLSYDELGAEITTSGGRQIMYLDWQAIDEEVRVDDLRRIVACVNACAGIPTELLEQREYGPMGLMSACADDLERWIGALRGEVDAFNNAVASKRAPYPLDE